MASVESPEIAFVKTGVYYRDKLSTDASDSTSAAMAVTEPVASKTLLMADLLPPDPTVYFSAAVGRMMEKMGFDGNALGRSTKGIPRPLRVSVRPERLGLGSENVRKKKKLLGPCIITTLKHQLQFVLAQPVDNSSSIKSPRSDSPPGPLFVEPADPFIALNVAFYALQITLFELHHQVQSLLSAVWYREVAAFVFSNLSARTRSLQQCIQLRMFPAVCQMFLHLCHACLDPAPDKMWLGRKCLSVLRQLGFFVDGTNIDCEEEEENSEANDLDQPSLHKLSDLICSSSSLPMLHISMRTLAEVLSLSTSIQHRSGKVLRLLSTIAADAVQVENYDEVAAVYRWEENLLRFWDQSSRLEYPANPFATLLRLLLIVHHSLQIERKLLAVLGIQRPSAFADDDDNRDDTEMDMNEIVKDYTTLLTMAVSKPKQTTKASLPKPTRTQGGQNGERKLFVNPYRQSRTHSPMMASSINAAVPRSFQIFSFGRGSTRSFSFDEAMGQLVQTWSDLEKGLSSIKEVLMSQSPIIPGMPVISPFDQQLLNAKLDSLSTVRTEHGTSVAPNSPMACPSDPLATFEIHLALMQVLKTVVEVGPRVLTVIYEDETMLEKMASALDVIGKGVKMSKNNLDLISRHIVGGPYQGILKQFANPDALILLVNRTEECCGAILAKLAELNVECAV